MKYRREIDGLRALAVIPVIFFHAGFGIFSGGFVGVDVFFVISGYLITTIIITEKELAHFSLIIFYERRVRRILPALILVLAVCLPFAWFWLLPGDLKEFGRSLVAVSIFSSNILFWNEAGYFDTAAELKPLLHTWSLAVEEQYYLLFPIFLMLTWRIGKRGLIALLIVAAAISLTMADRRSIAYPEYAFFMLPTRGWELLIGSLVALHLNSKEPPNGHKFGSEIASLVGLMLLGYAVFTYDKTTPFPGRYALVPTIGAALIIIYGTSQTYVGRFLSAKVLVGIGLISYSAYLWHQPLFAFARHRASGELATEWMLALSAATFFLAYYSWRFVEQPFRSTIRVGRGKIFAAGASLSIVFILIGLAISQQNGFEGRITGAKGDFARFYSNSLPETRYFVREGISKKYREDCNFYDSSTRDFTGRKGRLNPKDEITPDCYSRHADHPKLIFIWGDSHAQQLYFGIKNNLPEDWQVLMVSSSGCRASLNAAPNRENYCEYSNWFAWQSIVRAKPDAVVIGQMDSHDPAKMGVIADELASLGVRRIIFTGSAPRWSLDLPKVFLHKLWATKPNRTFVGVNKVALQQDRRILASTKNAANFTFVSIMNYFCNSEGCSTYLGDDWTTGLTSWDGGHLTPIASDALGKDVLVPLIVKEGLNVAH